MMKTSLVEGSANYSLAIGKDTVDMNSLIGSPIKLTFAATEPTKASLKDTAFLVLDLLQGVTCAS